MVNYSVFHPIINCIVGFRECAMLINIANKTNTRIELHANGKVGSTDSIISLVQLGIKENSGVVFSIEGKNQVECCHLVMDLIKNGWQRDDNNQKKINSVSDIDQIPALVSVDDVINLHVSLNQKIIDDINQWDLVDTQDVIKYAC